MVHYISQRQATDRSDPRSSGNDLTTELAALETIGRALAELPDTASRMRVLRWAMERFAPVSPAPQPAPPPTPAAARRGEHDLTLTPEDVSELFAPESTAAEPARADERQPLESMVRGFVSDFQRLAREWNGE